MRKPIVRVLAGLLIGLAPLLGASTTASGETIAQITDNSTADTTLAISESNVVWTG